MAEQHRLTEKMIRQYVGDRSFERGRDYHEGGEVFDTRRQGATLKARSHGTSGGPYRVSVTLGARGIASSDCSCPVGPACKHVAAVLLTWLHDPDSFREVEDVDSSLGRRSKEELIALVKQMLKREPALEALLEMPLPGGKGPAAKPAVYRRQAESAFHDSDGEWGSWAEIARGLEAVKEVGDGYLEQGDARGAAAVYQGVAEAILDNYERYQDEEGDIAGVLVECSAGLGKCLAKVPEDAELRKTILKVLFEVALRDVEEGGTGLGDEAAEALEKQATPAEREALAGWVRKELKGASGEWARQSLGGWLLRLEGDRLGDEEYLALCREAGLRQRVVEWLLERGHVDEALEEMKGAADWELLQYADRLVKHRKADLADRLVAERARGSHNFQLLEWQKKRARERGDTAGALELERELFRRHPSLEGYRELRKLAKKQGTWDRLRPALLASLKKEYGQWLLVDVYLDEGELEEALALVRPTPKRDYVDAAGLKVAQAAEKTHPREALELYRTHAERLVGSRGRENYRQAARELKKVRELYGRLGEEAEWDSYLARLRQTHRALRAFQEELEAAKL